jgi:hypothetical protein
MSHLNLLKSAFEFNSPVNSKNTIKVFKEAGERIVDDTKLFKEQVKATLRIGKIDEENVEKYPYRNILQGVQSPSIFSHLFFSKSNIQEIQTRIKNEVYNSSPSKYIIKDQKEIELVILMKGIYMIYGRVPSELSNFKEQISNLNGIVVDKAVPTILTGIKQHIGFIRDSQYQPRTISRPENTSKTGLYNQRSVTDVLIGDENLYTDN